MYPHERCSVEIWGASLRYADKWWLWKSFFEDLEKAEIDLVYTSLASPRAKVNKIVCAARVRLNEVRETRR